MKYLKRISPEQRLIVFISILLSLLIGFSTNQGKGNYLAFIFGFEFFPLIIWVLNSRYSPFRVGYSDTLSGKASVDYAALVSTVLILATSSMFLWGTESSLLNGIIIAACILLLLISLVGILDGVEKNIRPYPLFPLFKIGKRSFVRESSAGIVGV